MKKSILSITLLLAAACYAQETISPAQKKFIKGSISDKTAAVKEASGSELQLAETGLDFVLAYQPYLGNDRDLAALAVASILALPKPDNADKDYIERVSTKLVSLFNLTSDETVRITILDRLAPFAELAKSEKAINLMNVHLSDAAAKDVPASPVILASIVALGKTGNSASFGLMYTFWKEHKWPQYADEIEKALVSLSESCVSDAVKVVASSDAAATKAYFDILVKHTKKMHNFLAEIAENVLSKAINTVVDVSSKDAIELQISSLQVIAEAQWTRASNLVISFFGTAREEYASGVLSEAQFTDVIANVAKLASPDSTATLTAYLADLNKTAAANAFPAKPVVLAVIAALGELGDKAAFDTLLYVTYLSYPEDVIQAARDALKRLKW